MIDRIRFFVLISVPAGAFFFVAIYLVSSSGHVIEAHDNENEKTNQISERIKANYIFTFDSQWRDVARTLVSSNKRDCGEFYAWSIYNTSVPSSATSKRPSSVVYVKCESSFYYVIGNSVGYISDRASAEKHYKSLFPEVKTIEWAPVG
jgi:hypothetical protein